MLQFYSLISDGLGGVKEERARAYKRGQFTQDSFNALQNFAILILIDISIWITSVSFYTQLHKKLCLIIMGMKQNKILFEKKKIPKWPTQKN